MSFDRYTRVCVRILARLGVEPHAEPHFYSAAEVVAHTYANDSDRLLAWYSEALLHGLQSCERADWIMAARCYFQAVEYKSKGGINEYGIGTEEAAHELRNEVERALRASTAPPKCQIGWIDCEGTPTADNNDAVGFAVLNGRKYPICERHKATMGRTHSHPDCTHESRGAAWTFEPLSGGVQ